MHWEDVTLLWQRCFELAWETHLEGSNPIGALVADAQGNVVSTGKSAVRAPVTDVKVFHNEIAHAEVNALLQLDNRVHPKTLARSYALYSTMEPCPLCFSAFYMSDVETLQYAARDCFGGSTNLLGTTAYLSRKARALNGPEPVLGDFSIYLFVCHDLGIGLPMDDPVHESMAEAYPRAVAMARSAKPGSRLMDEESVGVNFDRFVQQFAQEVAEGD